MSLSNRISCRVRKSPSAVVHRIVFVLISSSLLFNLYPHTSSFVMGFFLHNLVFLQIVNPFSALTTDQGAALSLLNYSSTDAQNCLFLIQLNNTTEQGNPFMQVNLSSIKEVKGSKVQDRARGQATRSKLREISWSLLTKLFSLLESPLLFELVHLNGDAAPAPGLSFCALFCFVLFFPLSSCVVPLFGYLHLWYPPSTKTGSRKEESFEPFEGFLWR